MEVRFVCPDHPLYPMSFESLCIFRRLVDGVDTDVFTISARFTRRQSHDSLNVNSNNRDSHSNLLFLDNDLTHLFNLTVEKSVRSLSTFIGVHNLPQVADENVVVILGINFS